MCNDIDYNFHICFFHFYSTFLTIVGLYEAKICSKLVAMLLLATKLLRMTKQ